MTLEKEIAIALLGASVGLGGLLLIFSGFLFSQAAAFPKDTTDDAVIDRFRLGGRLGIIPFLVSLIVAGMSLAWLLWPNQCLFVFAYIGFFVLLLGTAVYGIWIIFSYL